MNLTESIILMPCEPEWCNPSYWRRITAVTDDPMEDPVSRVLEAILPQEPSFIDQLAQAFIGDLGPENSTPPLPSAWAELLSDSEDSE